MQAFINICCYSGARSLCPVLPNRHTVFKLHKDFTFDDAAAIAEYLSELGVSHVYSSPYLQAAPGSMHGYDVVDHRRLNEELGGLTAHKRFSDKLGETRLGQVLDIVPNHMSLGRENTTGGTCWRTARPAVMPPSSTSTGSRRKSAFATRSSSHTLATSTAASFRPVASRSQRSGSRFLVCAADQSFPSSPLSLTAILAPRRGVCEVRHPQLPRRLLRPPSGARVLGPPPDPDAASRQDRAESACSAASAWKSPQPARPSTARSAELNANQDALDDFLKPAELSPAYWKTADQQLGYRRFFDVNTLIGLRMEREHVFEETHALILDWLKRACSMASASTIPTVCAIPSNTSAGFVPPRPMPGS